MPGQEIAAAAGPAEGGPPENAPNQSRMGPIGKILATVARMAFMYWLMNYMRGSNKGQPQSKDPVNYTYPKFLKGDMIDMYIFLNELASVPGGRYDGKDLVWLERDVPLAEPDTRNTTLIYHPSEDVKNNGTLFMHVVFAKAGHSIDMDDPEYNEDIIFGRTYSLTSYLPQPKNDTGVNLLSAEGQSHVLKDEGPREIVSFIKPNMSIQIVDHFITYPKNNVPPTVLPWVQFGEDGHHYPIIYFNDFWLLKDKLVQMNKTVDNVTLHFDLSYISMTWWQLQLQMTKSFEMQQSMGMQQEGDSDELKRIFLEGNPYLLGLTMVVSLFHTVFDMLAFKNDIGFWKSNKSMEGLSARSILINAFCQLVILLYLFDNDTSFVVLLSAALGTAIEFWKVTKAMNVRFDPARFPFVRFQDRDSYSTNNTKQHDEDAMRYLSYVLYPLVIGYAVYALLYKTHKSWYSWILSSLVGAVYMFGFILMCPQLYLNYKLKSVAHLPWRQMTYKFLNTIIDDLFAFVIKMPLLHRLSVFRDDLIFLIYLYQRWIYPTDTKRVNEFGWAPEDAGSDQSSSERAQLQGPAQDPVAQNSAQATVAGASKQEGAELRHRHAAPQEKPGEEEPASEALPQEEPEVKKDL